MVKSIGVTTYESIVGLCILMFRKKVQMRQEEFSELIGYTPASLSYMETGKTGFDVTQLIQLSITFGMMPTAFLELVVEAIDGTTEIEVLTKDKLTSGMIVIEGRSLRNICRLVDRIDRLVSDLVDTVTVPRFSNRNLYERVHHEDTT